MLAQAKNDEIIAALLLLLAEITSFLALRPSQEQQDAGKELVSHVINRRIKVSERSVGIHQVHSVCYLAACP